MGYLSQLKEYEDKAKKYNEFMSGATVQRVEAPTQPKTDLSSIYDSPISKPTQQGKSPAFSIYDTPATDLMPKTQPTGSVGDFKQIEREMAMPKPQQKTQAQSYADGVEWLKQRQSKPTQPLGIGDFKQTERQQPKPTQPTPTMGDFKQTERQQPIQPKIPRQAESYQSLMKTLKDPNKKTLVDDLANVGNAISNFEFRWVDAIAKPEQKLQGEDLNRYKELTNIKEEDRTPWQKREITDLSSKALFGDKLYSFVARAGGKINEALGGYTKYSEETTDNAFLDFLADTTGFVASLSAPGAGSGTMGSNFSQLSQNVQGTLNKIAPKVTGLPQAMLNGSITLSTMAGARGVANPDMTPEQLGKEVATSFGIGGLLGGITYGVSQGINAIKASKAYGRAINDSVNRYANRSANNYVRAKTTADPRQATNYYNQIIKDTDTAINSLKKMPSYGQASKIKNAVSKLETLKKQIINERDIIQRAGDTARQIGTATTTPTAGTQATTPIGQIAPRINIPSPIRPTQQTPIMPMPQPAQQPTAQPTTGDITAIRPRTEQAQQPVQQPIQPKNTVFYTGSTNPNITEFKPGGDGTTKTSGDSFGEGVYLTDNPDVAKLYAGGGNGKVYTITTDNSLLNLNDKADTNFVKTVSEALTDAPKQYRNRILRDIGRAEKYFDDTPSAKAFFDEATKTWEVEDGEYDSNKPTVNKRDGKFAIEYTDFNSNIQKLLENTTNEQIFKAIAAINTNNASGLVTEAGFDGIIFKDRGAFNSGIEGNTAVIYKNTQKIKQQPIETAVETTADIKTQQPTTTEQQLIGDAGHKQEQLEIVLKHSPVDDTLGEQHTWIRSIDDIKTYQEALADPDYAEYIEEGFAPDYDGELIKKALEENKITVYSSYPVKKGVFVTPSKMEAESYAGTGEVYSKQVKLEDVAWIDVMEGQYAPVEPTIQPQTKIAQPQTETKEPWQMTQKEFTETVTERTDKVPEISFKEFYESRGHTDKDLATDREYADVIGGMFTETTKAGKGKLKAPIKKIELTNQLLQEYREAIDNGDIKKIDNKRPIRNTRQDEAYKRVQHKRAIAQALKEGKPVPQEVLKDYPNLKKQQPTVEIAQPETTNLKNIGEVEILEDMGDNVRLKNNKGTEFTLGKQAFNNLKTETETDKGVITNERKSDTQAETQTGDTTRSVEDVPINVQKAFVSGANTANRNVGRISQRNIETESIGTTEKIAYDAFNKLTGHEAYFYTNDNEFEYGFASEGKIFIAKQADSSPKDYLFTMGHELGHLASEANIPIYRTIEGAIGDLSQEQIDSFISSLEGTVAYKKQFIDNPILVKRELINDALGNVFANGLIGNYVEIELTEEQTKVIHDNIDSFIQQAREQITPKQTIPIEDRTFENVGESKVKPIQHERPELKSYIQDEALRLLTELDLSVKGERMPLFEDGTRLVTGYTGTKRHTSEGIVRILDDTTPTPTYKEIANSLDRIRKGKALTALDKKIELVIDDNLSYGTTNIEGGKVEPNPEYVLVKTGALPEIEDSPFIEEDALSARRRRLADESKPTEEIIKETQQRISDLEHDLGELPLKVQEEIKDMLVKHKKLIADLYKRGTTKATKDEVKRLIKIKDSIPQIKKDIENKYKAKIKEVRATERARGTERKEKAVQKLKEHHKEVQEAKKERRELSKKQSKALKLITKVEKEQGEYTEVGKEALKDITGVFDTKAKSMREDTKIKLEKLDEYFANKEKEAGVYDIDGDKIPGYVRPPVVTKAIERLNKKSIVELSDEELDMLIDTIEAVRYFETHIGQERERVRKEERERTITTTKETLHPFRKAEKESKVIDMAAKHFDDTRGGKAYNYLVAKRPLDNKRLLIPMIGFDESHPLAKLFWEEPLKAESKELRFKYKIDDHFLKAAKDIGLKNLPELYGFLNEETRIKLPNGEMLKTTKGHRVVMKFIAKAEANRRNATEAGLRQWGGEVSRKFTVEEMKAIVNSMTKEEKTIADYFEEYTYNMLGEAVNETSLQDVGYKIAIEDNYLSIIRDSKSVATKYEDLLFDNEGEFIYGFLLSRTGGVTPMLWESVPEYIERTKNAVAHYTSKKMIVDKMKSVLGSSRIKDMLDPSEYKQLATYMKQFAGKRTEQPHFDKFLYRRLSDVRVSALARPSTALKQVPSALLIYPNHDYKHLQYGISHAATISNDDLRLVDEIFRDRLDGKVNVETYEAAMQRIPKTKFLAKLQHLKRTQTFLITEGDTLAMRVIVATAKSEIMEKYPELKKAKLKDWDRKYIDELADIALVDVHDSQPGTVLTQRSAVLRSKEIAEKLTFGMFTSATNKVYNKEAEAFMHLYGAAKGVEGASANKGLKILAGVIASKMGIALINLAVAKWRGREIDAKTIALSTIASSFYLASQLASVFVEGFELQNIITSSANKMFNSIRYSTTAMQKWANGEATDADMRRSIKNLAESITFFTGWGGITAWLKEGEDLIRNTKKDSFRAWEEFWRHNTAYQTDINKIRAEIKDMENKLDKLSASDKKKLIKLKDYNKLIIKRRSEITKIRNSKATEEHKKKLVDKKLDNIKNIIKSANETLKD